MDTEPNWNDSDHWSEFEWEKAFKFSESMTAKYFRMLSRFGDFPDAERLIASELGDQNLLQAMDNEVEFDLEFDFNGEGMPDMDEFGDDEFPDGPPLPGDPLFFEACPLYLSARKVAVEWTNVVSAVLEEGDRMWGLKVLFMMGRILSYLSMAIGDGVFEPRSEAVALAKRSLQQINHILGELDEKEARYGELFGFIREHLMETHEGTFDFINDLRNRPRKDEDRWR